MFHFTDILSKMDNITSSFHSLKNKGFKSIEMVIYNIKYLDY